MRNMLRALEKATIESVPMTSESLGIEPSIFLRVAKNCGFEAIFLPFNKGVSVQLKMKNIPVVMLYDEGTSEEFNYLDLSDLHVGHKKFSAAELEDILSTYYQDGKPLVDYVFIAGDLLEGITEESYTYDRIAENKSVRQKAIEIRDAQVNALVNILSKYDFDYRVINGNHEYGFEILGLESPLRIAEKKMRKKKKKFTFYDTYVVDFIIAGVCKRMMHIEAFNFIPGKDISYERLRRFKKETGLMVRYGKTWYPIRLMQCGHLHKRQKVYHESSKILITQPGSFVLAKDNQKKEAPGILVRGRVLKNKNIELY